MSINKLRKYHRAIGILTLIPLLIICLSGIVLNFRSQFNFLSPLKPSVLNAQFQGQWKSVESVLTSKDLAVKIKTITYNLEDRIIIVRTKDNYEFNLNGETGEVLSQGKKRSAFFYKMHQDIFLGDFGKKILSPLTGLLLLFLLVSGGILSIKRRKNVKRL